MLWLVLFGILFLIGGILLYLGLTEYDDRTIGGAVILVITFIAVIVHITVGLDHRCNYLELEFDKINIENKLALIDQMKETNFEINDGLVVDMTNKDLGTTINATFASLNKDIDKYNRKVATLKIAYKNKLVSACWKDYAKDTTILRYKDISTE